MNIAIGFVLCALVCTALAYPSEKQALGAGDGIAQAELFNGLRNAVRSIPGKLRRAIRNRICGRAPTRRFFPVSAAAIKSDDDGDDAHIEALAEVLLQSMQDDVDMQSWWTKALEIGTKALPLITTGLSLAGK